MSAQFEAFLTEVKATQMLWGLYERESDAWVVVDNENGDGDVLLLWSQESLAQAECSDEWSDYVPTQISVADWLEFWHLDLAEDNVVIGIDWQTDNENIELPLDAFSQAMADIEKV